MSWPQQQLCWLSIYLSVLALCIHAIEVSTDATNTTLRPAENSGNENLEVIDVAQTNQNNNEHVNTGQTTRIFTNGEVDDDFWLKHLGEDFKYAIHLQVDENDRYDGVFNMTEDGSNYDINHDYHIKEIPVDKNESKMQNKAQTQNQIEQHNTEDTQQITQNTQQNTENITGEQNSTIDKQSVDQNKQADNANEVKENADGKHLSNSDSESRVNSNEELQTTKKHTPNSKTEQENENDTHVQNNSNKETDSDTSWPSTGSSASPVIVTLPHNEKTVHQLSDENTPVVVKMPPVIYHHNPSGNQFSPESNSNTATQHLPKDPNISKHNQFYQDPHISTQHNHQYTLPNYYTYPTHQQHYENTDFTQQYNHHHFASSQSAQQQPYYTSSMLGDAAAYRRDPVFSSQSGSAFRALTGVQAKTSGGSIRFILRKPSTPYNGLPTHNQITF